MPLSAEDITAMLAAPFGADQISWRVGVTSKKDPNNPKGMCLAYIDARDVMDRLDGVVGAQNWQKRYVDAGNGKTCCEVGVRIDGEWVWKGDGAGDTGMEGDKGAFSDAFKRAAVSWGVGRYLYGLDSPWVPIEARGNSFIIPKSSKPMLEQAHTRYCAGLSSGAVSMPGQQMGNQALRKELDALKEEISLLDGMIDWDEWGKTSAVRIKRLPEEFQDQIRSTYKARKMDIQHKVAA